MRNEAIHQNDGESDSDEWETEWDNPIEKDVYSVIITAKI